MVDPSSLTTPTDPFTRSLLGGMIKPLAESQTQRPARGGDMLQEPWNPVGVADVDLLDDKGSQVGDAASGSLLVLVRLHTRTVGVVRLDLAAGETVGDQRERLRSTFQDDLESHRETFGCAVPLGVEVGEGDVPCLAHRRSLLLDAPTVSAIVATHDRPELLSRCLQSLLSQQHPPHEVIVVDNARSSDTTERLVQSDLYASRGVRYIREDIPGLGRAHNAGVANATGDILAITDDDVITDRHWLSALLEAFVENDAGCVTGLILPVELRTREQSWVEQYGGFARGFRQRSYSMTAPPEGDPLFPFAAGRFGSGANMAFTRAALERLGGFDPALGAGTKARGGDDLAAFAGTLLAGYTLVYQPDAVVRHLHHDNYAALHRMAHGYGVGLGAYLASIFSAQPRLVGEFVRRLPAGVRHLTSHDSEKNRNIRADYPRRLVLSERAGLLRGPFSYVASRRAAARPVRAP
jgi:glycosyltransferase involved in cell wall biosynthesis